MLINCRLTGSSTEQSTQEGGEGDDGSRGTGRVCGGMGNGLDRRPTSQKMVQLFGQQTNCKLL